MIVQVQTNNESREIDQTWRPLVGNNPQTTDLA
jgi:hypothetical protein